MLFAQVEPVEVVPVGKDGSQPRQPVIERRDRAVALPRGRTPHDDDAVVFLM
jgi:hypothetical protein